MTRFALNQESLPPLQAIQRFVNYFSRSRLRNNDFIDEAQSEIWEAGFSGQEADDAPFTFSWRLTPDGKPWVGKGTDANPLLVGITTKNLLRNAARDPASFVMHMDATFKLSQAWYPGFVVGISDSNRSFHLMAIFISSQRKEEHEHGGTSGASSRVRAGCGAPAQDYLRHGRRGGRSMKCIQPCLRR
jgi:hypothetical protein